MQEVYGCTLTKDGIDTNLSSLHGESVEIDFRKKVVYVKQAYYVDSEGNLTNEKIPYKERSVKLWFNLANYDSLSVWEIY